MSTLLSSRRENPLDGLVAMAAKKRGSPVYRDALARLGPLAARIIEHLAESAGPLQQRLQTLPQSAPTEPHHYDIAISSALALAVLIRFDSYVRAELDRRGIRHTQVRVPGDDFMRALRSTWLNCGDAGLVRLVAHEASHFLVFVEEYRDLKSAVRRRLGDFKQLF